MMMQSFVKFAWSFFKGLVWGLLFLLVLLVAAVSFVGFTAYGNQFAANQIANLASTPDLKISLQGARGLLQGHFRLDTATLSDTKGEFARIDGLKLDWTPTALFKQRFHAEEVSAAKVVFTRAPVQTIASPPSQGGRFSLPIEVAVDKIDLPLVALGEAVVGKDTEVAIAGSAKAITDQISLDIKANEKARPEAGATAKLAYGVNVRTLTLDARVAEPQGGLLAHALALPGTPPVEITVKGDGPLDAWQGAIAGKVNNVDVLHLAGKHTRSQEGLHELIINGGGQVSELLPPALRSLFAGETKVDINAEFNQVGLVQIRAGSIANDSLSVTASGRLDPKGDAALKATVTPAKETIDISLPLASGVLEAALKSVNVTLIGPFHQARLNLDAVVDHISTPDAAVEAIALKASSPAFNLENKSGPLVLTLTAGETSFKNEQAAKLIQGPLKIDAAMDVDPELINVERIAMESPKFGGTIAGEFKPLTKDLTADLKLFVMPDALLPPDLAAKAKGTIALSGKVAATLPDKAAVTGLKLASNLVNTEGTASYNAGALTASLRGALADLSLVPAGCRRQAGFRCRCFGQGHIAKNRSAGEFGRSEGRWPDAD
jgi:translocation and assembly module TamB